MLEAWLLAALAGAMPAAAADAPPMDLLEFLGEWQPAEQRLIDQAAAAQSKPRTRKDAADERIEPQSGPPR